MKLVSGFERHKAKVSQADVSWLQRDWERFLSFLFAIRWVFIIGIPVVAISWFCWITFFATNPASKLTDPALQYQVPEVAPTPTLLPDTSIWKNHPWLGPEQLFVLRSSEGVINLAMVHVKNTTVEFSPQTIKLDNKKWKQFNRSIYPSLTGATVKESAVVVQANNATLNFNVYQPFVFDDVETRVFVVDHLGNIWTTEMSLITLVDTAEIVQTLPMLIAPNPNLSGY